ncbi:MAG TPA: sugar phosphate isomerase/epimerase family protein [Actinomycetota bacterium]|nr:sugar phosphate isomerase/epimerase family protein [Actinomycetota bacterium]
MTARDLYCSFFLLTVDLRPEDDASRRAVVGHMAGLAAMGYTGFDLPVSPRTAPVGGHGRPADHAREIEAYRELRAAIEAAGLGDVGVTTNVAATSAFDPSSPDPDRRASALDYLKSRVDITAVLGGRIMAGPIVFPYNAFPTGDAGEPLWSDALQDWLAPGYERARPVVAELADYAEERGVKVAIEPVDRWEQPAPNSVRDVLGFLETVPSRNVGVCPDSAHVALGDDGPAAFAADVERAADEGRLHYVHVSAPGRGAVRDSWISWDRFLEPVLERYDGPLLVETFNAIPVFYAPLHLVRRKFWVPGEDEPDPGTPDAYTVARESLAEVRAQLGRLEGTRSAPASL